MRVNQVIIKEDYPLKNINLSLTPITLIVGNNDTGKTKLLNWISKGLFKKTKVSGTDDWVTCIDNHSNVQLDVSPLYRQYDGERMKNLLFVKDNDLVFKYKNQEELSKYEYWDREINSLLYGQDNISEQLQKSFLRSMGVGTTASTSWLIQLHERLFNLKNTLEEFIPIVESVTNKSDGLYQLNDSISKVNKIEQEFSLQEDTYFIMEKVEKAEKYFALVKEEEKYLKDEEDKTSKIEEQQKILQSIGQKDDQILDLENEIQLLKVELHQSENKQKQIVNSPMDSINYSKGESILEIVIGLMMSGLGVFFAYQSMHVTNFNMTKFLALGSFLIGCFYLAKIIIYNTYVQQIMASSGSKPNFSHQIMIDQAKKEYQQKEKDFVTKSTDIDNLKQEVIELRKLNKSLGLQIDVLSDQKKKLKQLQTELNQMEQELCVLYDTQDLTLIYNTMNDWKDLAKDKIPVFEYDKLKNIRYQKTELIDRRSEISSDYEKQKSTMIYTIRSLIEELKSIDAQHMISYFYPEINELSINSHINNYYELMDKVDILIDQVSKDRYKAEKITDIYNNVKSNHETLLSSIFASSFFKYLVEKIFNSKYVSFRIEHIGDKGLKIYAENTLGESEPLESFSISAHAQFWFVLRIVLAKSILGQQAGILLLDDPFSTFDVLKKKGFIDVLNVLVQEGWQLILTTTNDNTLIEHFQQLFSSKLTLLDLNKDY